MPPLEPPLAVEATVPWLRHLATACFLGTGFVALCCLTVKDHLVPSVEAFGVWLNTGNTLTAFSMGHTLVMGFLGGLASLRGQLSRDRAGELTKLCGYLYTLIGLLLVFQQMEQEPASGGPAAMSRVMPGIGTAILSSVVGWIFGTLLEGDAYGGVAGPGTAPASGGSSAPASAPVVTIPVGFTRALEDMRKAMEKLSRQGETTSQQLEAFDKSVQGFQTFLVDTAAITDSVRKLLQTEAEWRSHQESRIELISTAVQKLAKRYPDP